MVQRTQSETLAWYRTHETTRQIGFDPDGQCLKVCRTARRIPSMYPSAISAQNATPAKHRVKDLSKLRNGMVVYYDDPRDDNPFGHIVTITDHAKVIKSLADFEVRTNSVKSNQVVVVRGDYFGKHWGDKFQFAATWLNGQALLFPKVAVPTPPKPVKPVLTPLIHARSDIAGMLATAKTQKNARLVTALERDLAEINETINKFK